MKGCIPNEQEAIQTTGYVLQSMQFTRNVPKNDE